MNTNDCKMNAAEVKWRDQFGDYHVDRGQRKGQPTLTIYGGFHAI